MKAKSFAALLEGFFCDRLARQRRASPHTIASYRDTFKLLLRFAAERLGAGDGFEYRRLCRGSSGRS